MNFAEIYHKTEPPYCYPRNEKEMIVNIKTGYDVERVWICYGTIFAVLPVVYIILASYLF